MVDESRFTPGQCHVADGVIYDVIVEEDDEHIVMATCNGDQIVLYRDGRSLYRAAAGYESWPYRVEQW